MHYNTCFCIRLSAIDWYDNNELTSIFLRHKAVWWQILNMKNCVHQQNASCGNDTDTFKICKIALHFFQTFAMFGYITEKKYFAYIQLNGPFLWRWFTHEDANTPSITLKTETDVSIHPPIRSVDIRNLFTFFERIVFLNRIHFIMRCQSSHLKCLWQSPRSRLTDGIQASLHITESTLLKKGHRWSETVSDGTSQKGNPACVGTYQHIS